LVECRVSHSANDETHWRSKLTRSWSFNLSWVVQLCSLLVKTLQHVFFNAKCCLV
jgi:hypothetical protein